MCEADATGGGPGRRVSRGPRVKVEEFPGADQLFDYKSTYGKPGYGSWDTSWWFHVKGFKYLRALSQALKSQGAPLSEPATAAIRKWEAEACRRLREAVNLERVSGVVYVGPQRSSVTREIEIALRLSSGLKRRAIEYDEYAYRAMAAECHFDQMVRGDAAVGEVWGQLRLLPARVQGCRGISICTPHDRCGDVEPDDETRLEMRRFHRDLGSCWSLGAGRLRPGRAINRRRLRDSSSVFQIRLRAAGLGGLFSCALYRARLFELTFGDLEPGFVVCTLSRRGTTGMETGEISDGTQA